jgi:hypothetical protein
MLARRSLHARNFFANPTSAPVEIWETDIEIWETDIEIWETDIALRKNFVRIDEHNFSLLVDMLAELNHQDSFQTSALYYAYTGRRGIWLYHHPLGLVPLCWHPNLAGQILIFPLGGSLPPLLLAALLAELPDPPAGLRLARMSDSSASPAQFMLIDDGVARLEKITEDFLDWRTPVRVLATAKVAAAQGGDFMVIRNRLKQAQKLRPTLLPLAKVNSQDINDLILGWALKQVRCTTEIDAYIKPYQEIFRLAQHQVFQLDGVGVFFDGVLQALIAWDISNHRAPTANIFVNIANTACKGLSKLVIHTAAQILQARGIEFMNLGGSETESLDRFKAKFNPAYSLSLHSVDVTVERDNQAGELQIFSELSELTRLVASDNSISRTVPDVRTE